MISPIQKLQTKIKMTPTMTMIPPILQTWGTRKRARLPASVTRPDFKRLTKVALGGRTTCSPLSCGVQVTESRKSWDPENDPGERSRWACQGLGPRKELRQWLKTPRALRSAHR